MYSFQKQPPSRILEKAVLKICSKFTGKHPCGSVISIKLQSNFIEITLQHGCSPVNMLHIFRAPFSNNTSGQLLLSSVHVKNELVLFFPRSHEHKNLRLQH